VGLYQVMERLERVEALDGVAGPLQNVLGKAIKAGPVKDALSGTWLGHPVHPLLIVVPIGTWVSATVLDLLGGAGSRKAADRLLGLGILSALPTAATGASDWVDTWGAERRIGLLHAAGNTVALGLMSASWLARKRGRRGRGVVLALAGDALVGVTGYLGGHLSYAQGVGVDTTAFSAGPQDWTAVADEADLREGQPVGVPAGDATLLLLRRDGRILALHDRCTHRGAPLHKGKVEGDCIVCPWHGSTFRLDTGHIVRGPAVAPQPAYETRVRDGRVEVRRAEVKGQRAAAV
jgi:nitrite reductase/ring-hydroxylating ferredoxin subunit/uncharacterized membrane protein